MESSVNQDINLVIFTLECLEDADDYPRDTCVLELHRDGLELGVFAPESKADVTTSLHKLGIFSFFDFIFHSDALDRMEADELRHLQSEEVLWLREPEELHYPTIMQTTGQRRAVLPPWAQI